MTCSPPDLTQLNAARLAQLEGAPLESAKPAVAAPAPPNPQAHTQASKPRAYDPQAYIHRHRPLWNLLAFTYTGLSYLGGLALILVPNGWLNGLGIVCLTHSLVLSAYLSHELMHGTIFSHLKANARLGNIMLWLNGACYTPFSELARLHIAHHINRVDFCRFDLKAYLNTLPTWVRESLLVLEWLYFPALAFLSRWRALLAPFWAPERSGERLRVVRIFLIRLSLFAILTYISPKALLCYFLAYLGMITVLRFMDAFQHTYEVLPLGAELPLRDRAHEQANTFSNLLSQRFEWLNLLLLNFGYHNAHHEVMKCPWHTLPALERDLFAGDLPASQYPSHQVGLWPLLVNYHKFRLKRIFAGQGTTINEQGERCLAHFYGGIEVSFLVPPA